MQDKAAGGVLTANLNPSVWSALSEAPIWECLGRPVPALATDLLKQRDRLQLTAAQAHALTRSYNKVMHKTTVLLLSRPMVTRLASGQVYPMHGQICTWLEP